MRTYGPNQPRLRVRRPYCDSCDILVIQNVACHEIGCPNARKPMRYRKANGDPPGRSRRMKLPGVGEFRS